jgi:hypothetical protein
MRPGVEVLPASTPGRPRARFTVSPVTLPRRARREVYRVYTERDYMDAPLIEPVFPTDARHRLRRVAGAAMLVGAFGAVGGVLALNTFSPSGSTARRLGSRGGRGRLIAAGRSYPRERRDRRSVIRSRQAVEAPSPVSRARRTRSVPESARPALPARIVPAASHRRDIEAAYVAQPGDMQTGEAPAATQEDVVTPRVNAAAQSASSSPPPQHSEFGFER